MENILQLVGRLDQGMKDDLESLLTAEDGRLKNQLSLLVGRRNQIAHGHNEGMGTKAALQLVDDVQEIAAWFILNLEPARRR